MAERLGKRKTGDYVGPFSFQPYKMREYVGLIPKAACFWILVERHSASLRAAGIARVLRRAPLVPIWQGARK